MFKKIYLVLITLIISTTVWAQGVLRINNKEVEEGQLLNLFGSDLEAGKIVFSLGASKLRKAEITLDKGRTWQEMEKEGDYFIFGYRPLSEEVISPEFLLTKEDGGIYTYKPNIRINYQKKNPDEAVEQILEKMKVYYEEENIDRFMSLFSSLYPERLKFQESIQNDFYNYKNIRLRYRIDRRTFDSDYKGAIWDVYWERKYDDRTGSSFSDSAYITIKFNKEGTSWLISGLRNNTIFGSSFLALADLSISDSDVVCTGGGGSYIVVTVHNRGTVTASNVVVRIVGCGDKTIPNIPAGSSASVDFTGFGCAYCNLTGTSFTIIVDPANTINESNESNNSVTKTF